MVKKIFITFMMSAQIYSAIDINAFGIDKEALFIGACLQENFTLAKQLYDAGVDPAKIETGVMYQGGQGKGYQENVIFRFIKDDKIDVVKFLIETCKIDVNTKKLYLKHGKDGGDVFGENLLIYALDNNALLTAEYLLTVVDLDVNYVCNYSGNANTALNCCVSKCTNNTWRSDCFLIKLLNLKNIDLSSILKNDQKNIFERMNSGYNYVTLNCIEKILLHKDFEMACVPQNIHYCIGGNTSNSHYYGQDWGYHGSGWHVISHAGLMQLLSSRKSIFYAVKYKNLKMIKFLLNSTKVQDQQILEAYREAQLNGNFDIIEIFQNYFKQKQGLISTVVIPNNTDQQMAVLNNTEVPAQSKTVITTEISNI